MGISLGANQYGKAENLVAGAYRDTARHWLPHLDVLRPAAPSPTPAAPPTNWSSRRRRHPGEHRVAVFAEVHAVSLPEHYAIALGRRFEQAAPNAQVHRVRRSRIGSPPGPTATTTRSSVAVQTNLDDLGGTVSDRGDAEHVSVVSGITDIVLLKDDRLGVPRLPQGRVHHASGGRRSDHGDLARRPAGATRAPRSTGTPATTRSARSCWRRLPSWTAARCRRRCT